MSVRPPHNRSDLCGRLHAAWLAVMRAELVARDIGEEALADDLTDVHLLLHNEHRRLTKGKSRKAPSAFDRAYLYPSLSNDRRPSA